MFGYKTKTGAKWENKNSLDEFFGNLDCYQVKKWESIHQKNAFKLYSTENKKPLAFIFKGNAIYEYLKKIHGIEYSHLVSKKMLPDNVLFILEQKTFYIIECKTQNCAGSVDEKLQTCDFKLQQWKKILSSLECEVKYFYLLNYWFRNSQYKDVLSYIESCGCKYFFNYIPLKAFNLPAPNQG